MRKPAFRSLRNDPSRHPRRTGFHGPANSLAHRRNAGTRVSVNKLLRKLLWPMIGLMLAGGGVAFYFRGVLRGWQAVWSMSIEKGEPRLHGDCPASENWSTADLGDTSPQMIKHIYEAACGKLERLKSEGTLTTWRWSHPDSAPGRTTVIQSEKGFLAVDIFFGNDGPSVSISAGRGEFHLPEYAVGVKPVASWKVSSGLFEE